MLACASGFAVVSDIAFGKDGEQTTAGPAPLLIDPNSGKTGKFGGVEICFKLDSAQTAGNLGCAELTLAPGFLGAPPHYHEHFDEVIRVLEGTVTVLVGDTIYEVPAGGWHLRPRGKRQRHLPRRHVSLENSLLLAVAALVVFRPAA